jgi:[ribosomal protein S18]-alanine N-acetyltransferase
MSAQLDTMLVPSCRPMLAGDVDAVTAIEAEAYAFPWTRGNFQDSLQAGYECWLMECAGSIAGYAVTTVAAGEAHLLNLCVAVNWQRRGLGARLLRFVIGCARELGAETMFLEVRPSNTAARRLYDKTGFQTIALRRGYYPGPEGREDALVMEFKL